MNEAEILIEEFKNGDLVRSHRDGEVAFGRLAVAAGLYSSRHDLSIDQLIDALGEPMKATGNRSMGSVYYILDGTLESGQYIDFIIESGKVTAFGTNSTTSRDLKIDNYRNGKPKFYKSHLLMSEYISEDFLET